MVAMTFMLRLGPMISLDPGQKKAQHDLVTTTTITREISFFSTFLGCRK